MHRQNQKFAADMMQSSSFCFCSFKSYYQNRPTMATSAPRVPGNSGPRAVAPAHVYPPGSQMMMISQPFAGSPQGYFIPSGQVSAHTSSTLQPAQVINTYLSLFNTFIWITLPSEWIEFNSNMLSLLLFIIVCMFNVGRLQYSSCQFGVFSVRFHFKLEFSFIYLAPNPNSSHLKALYIVELSGNNGEKSQTIKWPSCWQQKGKTPF